MSDYSLKTKVLVGNSVWEEVDITRHDGKLFIEFKCDDLNDIIIPIEILSKIILNE